MDVKSIKVEDRSVTDTKPKSYDLCLAEKLYLSGGGPNADGHTLMEEKVSTSVIEQNEQDGKNSQGLAEEKPCIEALRVAVETYSTHLIKQEDTDENANLKGGMIFSMVNCRVFFLYLSM